MHSTDEVLTVSNSTIKFKPTIDNPELFAGMCIQTGFRIT